MDMRCSTRVLRVVCLWIGVCSAQYTTFGKCSTPEPIPTFNKDLYLGRWYEIESFVKFKDKKRRCAIHVLTDSGSGIIVTNSEIGKFKRTKTQDGIMTIPDPTGPARLRLQFSGEKKSSDDTDTNYWVLATDYNSYSAVYYCRQKGPFREENLMIFSRLETLKESTLSEVRSLLKSERLKTSKLKSTEQSKC